MKFTVSALMAASAAAIELDTQEDWDTMDMGNSTMAMQNATVVDDVMHMCHWDYEMETEVCYDILLDTMTMDDGYMTLEYHVSFGEEEYNWCHEQFDEMDHDHDGWISVDDYAEFACNEWYWCVDDNSEFTWFYDNDNEHYEGWMTHDDYCPQYAADFVSWCYEDFNEIDGDQDGWISIYDYAQHACNEWDWCVDDYSEFWWFNYYDMDQDGWMTYNDYCPWYSQDYSSWYDEDYTHWCADKFNNWDADHDGYVTAHDLQAWNCTEYGWCEYDNEQYSWVADYGTGDGSMSYWDYCAQHVNSCYYTFTEWDKDQDGWVSVYDVADQWCEDGFCTDNYAQYFDFFYEASEGDIWVSEWQYVAYCESW